MSDKMTLAVNHALAINAELSQAAMARSRVALLNPMGLDAKRCSAWSEYGWPDEISYDMLFRLYRRGGIAHGAVTKLIGNCWKTAPEVIEGDEQDESRKETPWERKSKSVLTARLWRAFAEADRRRLVGRYAGLILHIRDGRAWDQPVVRGRGIAKVTPAWAGALKPAQFSTEANSPEYGLPTMWHYTEAVAGSNAGRQISIHPDRVFILGDYADDAIGWLEPAYNAFVSLEKVEGGSGESFLKNASRQVSVNFDKEIDFSNLASMYGVSVDELQEKFNEAAREINRGNDQMLITQGATVAPLVSAVADPRPTYDVNLQTASAALDMPSRILVGNQQGNLASTEDQKYFNARCQARRQDLSYEIEDFVDHLIRIGAIDAVSKKSVVWDDLNEQTASEKLDSAKKMSEINQAAIATGEPVFAADEIRTAAGYDPAGGEPLGEEDDDGEGTETGDPAE